jgi:hypothetical protein
MGRFFGIHLHGVETSRLNFFCSSSAVEHYCFKQVVITASNISPKSLTGQPGFLRLVSELSGAAATRTRTATRQTGYTASALPASLRGVLRERSEIRRAVILREVLGPPLGLR